MNKEETFLASDTNKHQTEIYTDFDTVLSTAMRFFLYSVKESVNYTFT